MTILEGDIKLLKSAVMADTTDGGGAMTGVSVLDGQSNNLFPDTSEVDRALGRVNMRKVFGVAHTSNTDTLLGAHAIITDAPDDPLVHCALMRASGWSDTRDTAKDTIERYLVKGPRLTCRLLDMHYAGSMSLRVWSPTASLELPAGGEAVVLLAPDGTEQYVRVLRISARGVQQFVGSTDKIFTAQVATLELGQALTHDFKGHPTTWKDSDGDSSFAKMHATSPAIGAQFYGVKPLGVSAHVGDSSATVSGGVFTPLVPSATVETPIIDQYPYVGKGALSLTAMSAATLVLGAGDTSHVIQGGSVLTLASPLEPKSLQLTINGVAFTDAGDGTLLRGATVVGAVNYQSGVITFTAGGPEFGYMGALTYRPATQASVSAFNTDLIITSVNQGLGFTNVFQPPPAPMSFSLSYMAQGRWYTLRDNGVGKLVGDDSSYGVGSIDYTTGSMAVTLGAIPDIGSSLIADWGDPSSARKVSAALPSALYTSLALPAGTKALGIIVSWNSRGTTYTATTDAGGVLSGGATGRLAGQALEIEPISFPDGDFTVTRTYVDTTDAAFSTVSDGHYVAIPGKPVVPGTVKGTVYLEGYAVHVADTNGELRGNHFGIYVKVGSVDYITGSLNLQSLADMMVYGSQTTTSSTGWQTGLVYGVLTSQSTNISITGAAGFTYSHGDEATETLTIAPSSWCARIPTQGHDTLLTSSALFTLGGVVYTSDNGNLNKGWSLVNGGPAATGVGSLTAQGALQMASVPANTFNTVTWHNLAQDLAVRGVSRGIFRTTSAPLKTGVFQLQSGLHVASGADAGTLTGAFTGTIDYLRGVVRWNWAALPIDPASLSYNAVFLQYLPLDAALLGLDTARLPLDGKVPIFRSGGLVVVHNTQTYSLPNPLVKNTPYNLGRVRIAAVKVRTQVGATVDSTLYSADLDAGTITFNSDANLTGLTQPFTVDHRIEDMQLCSVADISGKLTFTRPLTHNYPAESSYISSALVVGDVFARAYNPIEQTTWTGVWSDSLVGSAPLANFNEAQNPLVVTNKGAITEKWAVIFTNSTAFRVIGQSVGEIATGSTGADCAPLNPATGVPYFTIPAMGWGNGWAAGNVYRFNTAACGAPLWVVRTVLQGPATLQDDKFTLAFRGDVDRP